MRIIAITSALALVLGAAACNRSDSDADVAADTNLAVDNATDVALGNETGADAALPTTGADFAKAVAASDLYEIESAKLAADKATSADLKTFAAKLRDDHEKSSADLKAAAAKASPPVTVSPALDAEKQGLIDALKAAKGADFDRTFIDQQTAAHQKALTLVQNYAAGGDSAPLKEFATKAANVVQGHLEHLNGIKK